MEWNDAIICGNRGARGGSWNHLRFGLRSSLRFSFAPNDENSGTGFRVAAIPEWSSILMLLITLGASAVVLRKRFSHR